MMSDLHDPVNLGNTREISILELGRIVKKLVGSKSKMVFNPLPEDDPKKRKPDISRASKELKWQPKIRLEEGLMKSIHWYKDNPHLWDGR